MDLFQLRDYIGLYAPIILFILSIFFLLKLKNYLTFFTIGFIINNILNIVLKLAIKEPRPSKDQKAIEIGVINGARIGFDKFGMPSGHSQNCGFCLSFITLVLNKPFITSLFLIISIISLFQRYIYNNHTILQLSIGFIIGLLMGTITYFFAIKFLIGNINGKKDDNCLI